MLKSTHEKKELFRSKSIIALIPLTILTVIISSLTNNDVTYLISEDIFVLLITVIGFLSCPYKEFKAKGFLFAVTLWQMFVVIINSLLYLEIFALPEPYSIAVFISIFSAVLFMLVRQQMVKKFVDTDPKDDHAFYILTETHSLYGLFHCLIMPWHAGRYETRAISDGKNVWLVHKGSFICTHARNVKVMGGVKVPLGRPLTTLEYIDLDFLEGVDVKVGIKDCRHLLVAGKPENFIDVYKDIT